MYRLQKAVQKAKSKSGDISRKASNFEKQNPVVSPLENIEYTHTKVVDVPKKTLVDNRVIAGVTNNHHTQLYRTLRTQIIHKLKEKNLKNIGICSPTGGEGTATFAANLAIAMAREVNQTVLLVDLDLINPTLANAFGVTPDKGVLDFLKDGASIEELLISPGIERLVMIPGKGSLLNSSEYIASPKMLSLINETKNRYKSRIIMYVLPPVLPTDDVLSVAKHLDSTLLVLQNGKNSKKNIEKAMSQLKNTEFLGYVLNNFKRYNRFFSFLNRK